MGLQLGYAPFPNFIASTRRRRIGEAMFDSRPVCEGYKEAEVFVSDQGLGMHIQMRVPVGTLIHTEAARIRGSIDASIPGDVLSMTVDDTHVLIAKLKRALHVAERNIASSDVQF
jgi:hypothetical protein